MARRPDSRLRFTFLGWQAGWYVLRLPTRGRNGIQVHAFRATIVDWLIEQDITPNLLSYLANGNTGDGPVVPALEDGSALCLLFRQPADVIRFERAFGCRNLTADAMFAALQAEASVHRFVLADVAAVAYDAAYRLQAVFDDAPAPWDQCSETEQRWFLLLVREYLEHPERSAEQRHTAWLDTRTVEGWTYGPTVNLDAKRHPWLVPFARLSDQTQAVVRLIANVVSSLMPLLKPRG